MAAREEFTSAEEDAEALQCYVVEQEPACVFVLEKGSFGVTCEEF